MVAGQRLMQAATDVFLGWQRIRGPTASPATTTSGSSTAGRAARRQVQGAVFYAHLRATLARPHARMGDRIAIASYLGGGDTSDRAIADFSAAYADQKERSYRAFAAAVSSGRLTARPVATGRPAPAGRVKP